VATPPPAINVSNNVASGPNAVTQSFNDLSAKLADAAAKAAPPPPSPSPASTVAPVTSDPGPPLPPPPFSPLFTASGETRPATDQELNGLLDGLKYDPVGVVLTPGAPQFVNLVDAAGEILMTVALGWSRTGPNTVKVLVNVTNLSNCIADTYGSFASSGKIDDKTWVGGIDAITYNGWKPVSILSAGRSETFGGTVTVGDSVKDVLIFHPQLLRSTLSQCRTLQ
jgi:hypothetical protein